ncbi:MAG: DNA polymerase I [Lachnospiraceae bacterium]|jgi:DNA polymerase-1|nr:DNA polymerase I [Lachnospiraceae bacterium]
MGKLVLIDGHSILNRAFYGVPDLTNSEGLHTNAVYGFLNIMFKILDEEKADYLAVAFDLSEPTFRHKLYAEYKGTRKPMPQELVQQVPLIQEALKAMGITILTKPGYEADDILGTAAKRGQAEGMEVSVISGDRDLLQLSDEKIKIRIPKTSKGNTEIYDYYPEDVKREYLVTPNEFIDVKALMGDASDNIPGVPSIGEKTATAIIAAYGTIENAYAHLEEIKPPRAKKALAEHFDLARLSKELAKICIDCEIPFSCQESQIKNLYTPEAFEFMKRMEFKSFLARFQADSLQNGNLEDHFRATEEKEEGEAYCKLAEGLVKKKDEEKEYLGLQIILGEKPEPEEEPEGEQLSFLLEADGNIGLSVKKKKTEKKPEKGKKAVAAVVLAFQEETVCIKTGKEISEKWLLDRIRKIILKSRPGRIWVLDLKKLLPVLGLEEESASLMDSGVAAYLLNPLKDSYDYDDIARDYLGLVLPSQKDLLGKEPVGNGLMAGEENALRCACYMACAPGRGARLLEEKLKGAGMWDLYLTIEMPLIYSLYHMEQAGVKVQQKALKEYGDKLKVKIGQLEKQIYEGCGETFNINSPKQLGEILFEKMQLKGGKKTKTGYSTAADVLEKLAPDVPVVRMILDYRQLTKLNSTYAEGLSAFIGTDQRIHGTFNQTITATGRISSTEPNLQNIPVRMELGREIRKVFVPEEGYVFLDADYSQIELRILASLSEDERLIDAYGLAQDIHAITASQVFHIPLEEVTPLQRRNAKAVNFGIVYGISAFGLGEDLSVSKKEAQDYINQYFKTYPGVKEYLDRLVAEGKKNGYVCTLYGRRRPIPELKSANFMQRSFGERVAMNSPIQGTAADIMKLAMIGVDRELRKRGMKSRIVLQVHDELLIETWKEETQTVKEILEDKMKHAAALKVSLEVEAKEGDSWFAAK